MSEVLFVPLFKSEIDELNSIISKRNRDLDRSKQRKFFRSHRFAELKGLSRDEVPGYIPTERVQPVKKIDLAPEFLSKYEITDNISDIVELSDILAIFPDKRELLKLLRKLNLVKEGGKIHGITPKVVPQLSESAN